MLRYGVREAADIVVRNQKTKEPILLIDTAKVVGLEATADQTYATGGFGNPRLMAFNSSPVLSCTLQNSLLDSRTFKISMGAKNKKFSGSNKGIIRGRKVSMIDDNGQVTLDKKALENDFFVFITENGYDFDNDTKLIQTITNANPNGTKASANFTVTLVPADSDTFTITSNSGGTVETYEFEVAGGTGGVTPGNISVIIDASATNDEIAMAISDAINTNTASKFVAEFDANKVTITAKDAGTAGNGSVSAPYATTITGGVNPPTIGDFSVDNTGTNTVINFKTSMSGKEVIVFFQYEVSNGEVWEFSANDFRGCYFEVEMQTVWQPDINQAADCLENIVGAQVVIYRASFAPMTTLTFQPDGDPATFDLQFSAMRRPTDQRIFDITMHQDMA